AARASQAIVAPSPWPSARSEVTRTIIMRMSRFRHLLETHGPDLSSWPPELASPARVLVSRQSQAARELAAAQHLEELIAHHFSSPAGQVHFASAAARVITALGAGLPAQRRSWLANWWPVELLDVDFAPAWRRLAVLAGIAGLGFILGLADPTRPGL